MGGEKGGVGAVVEAEGFPAGDVEGEFVGDVEGEFVGGVFDGEITACFRVLLAI